MGCREVLFLVFSGAIRANADGFPGLAVSGFAMPDATAKLDDFFGAIPVVFGLKCQGKREELVQIVNADLKRTGRVWGTIRLAVLLQLLEQGHVDAGVAVVGHGSEGGSELQGFEELEVLQR